MAVLAGTAVFFSAEENVAETKIWDREMAGIRNATALPEQLARKFLIRNNLVWKQAEDKCKSYGAEVCPLKNVCNGKSPNAQRVLCTERGRKRCTKKDERQLQSRWVPVKVEASKQWVSTDDCSAVEFPEDKKMRGVVACCGMMRGKGPYDVLAVHLAPVVQEVRKSGLGKRKYRPGQRDSWSQHEYVDKMRSNDPFLAHKQSGTKVKSFHEHVTDKAKEHLGTQTVNAISDKIADIHGQMKSGIGLLLNSFSPSANATSTSNLKESARTKLSFGVTQAVRNATKQGKGWSP
ncbi:hypothetical protein GUITHDRAFT_151964 [Guillardia theta CCMP2712]|uniref:Uncharacterized protein n=2 Tax=Guillardia theta TaxID=55529 RepID=L1JHL0_GUITC|nr:hypothetical protein GUITHDRAFT_151964 [Guillardia theta CCMP2712]EKX47782.1 hypothetical protein GUITHDRAFT_151964 [Guillardia theta CCMP2712]|mmetsp:Transcript_12839/g.45065  ORF Transcript_12839/g.45065 Transcript_12839/m.45065 type:complete len:292 (+) Transcript_12839:407-1282(+)|eukprot:XP_005834762.1 hypothetical protein GUITHDRAFT_151964 [Guillardia theta CCMP2712]